MSESTTPTAWNTITWHDAFAEGERRIREKWVDTLVKTPSEDRTRLMAERESIQKKISRALAENNTRKLRAAFRAQILLLTRLNRLT